jgi:hypothetical protein
MRFFDVNAMLGPCFAPRFGRCPSPEDLLADMDLYGVEQTLVYSGLAYEYHAMTGNRELAALIGGQPRLPAAWVVGPHQAGLYPPPGELVNEMLESGAVAARFFWGGTLAETTYPDPDTYEALWGELQRHRVPTLVGFDEAATLTGPHLGQMTEMLRGFPDLPVILSFARLARDFSILFDRLERHPSLHVETTGLMSDYLIEDLVQRFGAERLIFGSNFPWYKAGQTRVALAYAEITETEKALIAGENLRRLIGGIQ